MSDQTKVQRLDSSAYLDKENKILYSSARAYFMLGNLSPEEFAAKNGLNETALEIIKRDDWLALREAYNLYTTYDVSKVLATIADADIKLEMQAKVLAMQLFEDQIKFYKEHREKHGDLFSRDANGDIMLDVRGNPHTMSLPTTPMHLLSRTKHFELIEKFLKVIKEFDGMQKLLGVREGVQSSEQEVVNSEDVLEKYKHYLEPGNK